MLISFDKTNFPLAVVEDAGVEVHLLPVTKIQFEQYANETGAVNRSRYEDMLALNPAVEPDKFRPEERERLFATGVLPREALDFARWLGDGYDLPTVKEWRAVLAALRRTPVPRQAQVTDVLSETTLTIIQRLAEQIHIRSMLDFSLMREGLVEWVWQGKALVGLGAPRPEFHPNLWDPLVNEIKPIHLDQRVPYFGFRLVRRGEAYLSDREDARFVF
jgi:hypothetical protein